LARLLTSRDAFDVVARSLLGGPAPVRHAALLVGELDDFQALATRVGSRAADGVAAQVGRLLVSLLRGDDVVFIDDEGRFLLLLPGNTADEGRQVGERLANAVRIYGLAVADRQVVDRLSISFGVAAYPDHGQSIVALYDPANAACARIATSGGDGAAIAPLAHHGVLHRPLSIDRFAGRVAELTTLVRYVDDAIARRPHVVSVVGESGLGSATLLRQLESHVRFRGGTMITAVSPQSPVPEPYAVWAGIIKGLQRLPDSPEREWRELHKLVPALGVETRDQVAGSQYRLLEELFTHIAQSSENRPLILVLDEMQWADDTSWEALSHVVGRLTSERILIFITCRAEREFADAAERRHVLKHNPLYSEVVLNRLTRDEVKQWLSGAFHKQEIGREFLAFLYRHTEGNPFFLSQLASALVEQGALWHSGVRHEWIPVSELRLPSDVDALIAQRLLRFSASTQAILTTAAILGRDFDVTLLVAAGAGTEPAIRLAMNEAMAAGMIRPKSDRRAGGYGFTHDRIASVLVDAPAREGLRELHRRMAHALVARGDRTAGEIAVHYHIAQSTGLAYEYARKAAVEAEHVYAVTAARAYLDLAIQNSASPAELADVRVHLAHLSEIRGRYDEVEELCDLAIEWYEGQRDVRHALAVRRIRERARLELGLPAREALEALDELGEQARELGFDDETVAINILSSLTHSRLGDTRKAERLANEAVEVAEQLGKRDLLAEAIARLGVCLIQADPRAARESLHRAIEIYESLGDIRGLARAQNSLAIAFQFEGRLIEAHDAFEQAMAMAKTAGMPDIAGAAAMNLATHIQKAGDFARARELFAESMTSFSNVRNSGFQVIALFNMAHGEREQGHWESALELYSTTSSLAERIGHGDMEIGSLAGIGLCYLGLGRLDEAREIAAEIKSRLDRRPEWFQGREVAEALTIRTELLGGHPDSAFDRFERTLLAADLGDAYPAVWLTLNCAADLSRVDSMRARIAVERYAPAAEKLGYPEVTRRFNALLDSTRESVT
jgi:diguanylate cyclase (GGDEF)-like protein